ncbi:MAG: DUF1549 domain-containing protein, partial [Verrucomicrobiota bacterium]
MVILQRVLLAVVGMSSAWGFTGEELSFFEREVRPLLAEHCYDCHSVEAEKLKGDLLLDSREGMLRGGFEGAAVVPGDVEGSLLVETIRYGNQDLQMPPKYRLDEKTVAVLEKWVAMGAPWPEEEAPSAEGKREVFDLAKRQAEHWCWQELGGEKIPEVENEDWPLHAVDAFVLAELEARGLKPAGEAEKRVWLRRVSFDLIGLPPTVEELKAFLEDDSEEAFERVVERLLDDPGFGEKWGRHWLDLMRYAEGYGHEFDYVIPQAWKYRDYVVRAFNADLPYDDFVVEHAAGDLLEKPRRHAETGWNESVIGTGSWWLGEATHAPTDVAADEDLRIDNQIDVFTKSVLGLTVSCARCHDHKFDAISTADFYALSGFLQSSRRELVNLDAGGKRVSTVAKLQEVRERAATVVEEDFGGPVNGEGLARFDGGSWEGWTVSGEAFGEGPTRFGRAEVVLADEGQPLAPGGVAHSGLLGSELTGVLRSPTFVLEQPEIHLWMQGEGHVEARVIVDGYFMDGYNPLLFRGTRLKEKS